MSKRDTTGLPKKRKRTKLEQGAEQQEETNLLDRLLGSDEYMSRADREARVQRFIWVGIGVLVAVLVVLIGGALLWEQVITPNRTVATVNGEDIDVSEFQERVRLERVVLNQRFNNDIAVLLELGQDPNSILQQEPYATWWQEISIQPELLGSRVLDEMIEEQLVRQQAAELGVTIDQQAVEEQVEQFFNYNAPAEEPEGEAAAADPTETPIPSDTPTPFVSPTPSSTPEPTDIPTETATPTPLVEAATEEAAADVDPTPTARPSATPTATPSIEERQSEFEQTVDAFYSNARREAGLSRETVRSYFEYEALLAQLRDVVTEDIDREAPFVNARHILVDTEEQAQNVIEALEAGEIFADLARAVSTDSGSGARGGELGWSPASSYVPEFSEAVLNAEIGEIVGPVESEFGYHIIQVRAREDREMTDAQFEQARNQAFNEWLENTTSAENNDIERRDNWPAFVPLDPQFVYRPTGVEPEETAPQGA